MVVHKLIDTDWGLPYSSASKDSLHRAYGLVRNPTAAPAPPSPPIAQILGSNKNCLRASALPIRSPLCPHETAAILGMSGKLSGQAKSGKTTCQANKLAYLLSSIKNVIATRHLASCSPHCPQKTGRMLWIPWFAPASRPVCGRFAPANHSEFLVNAPRQ